MAATNVTKTAKTTAVKNEKFGIIVHKIDKNLIEFKLSKKFHEKTEFQKQIVLLIDSIFKLFYSHPDTTFNLIGEEVYGANTNIIDADTRNKIVTLFESPQLNKVGLYGGNIISKNLSNMLAIVAAKNREFKYFDNKKDAIAWLNE